MGWSHKRSRKRRRRLTAACFAAALIAAGGAEALRAQLRAGPTEQHKVDAEAADRGRDIWAAECINCHGTYARGSERGANLIHSQLFLRDRYGSTLGPFLKKGHPRQSGSASADLTQMQVEELSHFIHQRVFDTLRGSPIFEMQNVLTGDAAAGEAYFNGAGGCNQCHSPSGDLAGIGGRLSPPALQSRFLFPQARGRRRSRFRQPGPAIRPTTVTVTPPGEPAVTGVLAHLDDFNVSLRDESGEYRSWKRGPQLKVEKHDPYAAHIDLLDKYTDKNMHDIVAYLETLQ